MEPKGETKSAHRSEIPLREGLPNEASIQFLSFGRNLCNWMVEKERPLVKWWFRSTVIIWKKPLQLDGGERPLVKWWFRSTVIIWKKPLQLDGGERKTTCQMMIPFNCNHWEETFAIGWWRKTTCQMMVPFNCNHLEETSAIGWWRKTVSLERAMSHFKPHPIFLCVLNTLMKYV